jgi:thiol-disulfide isomerase/thioredoxin
MLHSGTKTMRRRLISLAALALAIVIGLALERFGLSLLGGEQPLPPVAFEVQLSPEQQTLPSLRFVDAEGRAATLDDFRGRVVLLNLWATWCVPCRREMPALDRLQSALGGRDFVVLPLAVDRGGIAPVKHFFEELGVKALGVFIDQSQQAIARLGSPGLPTTLLIDREGHEIGRQLGAAAWDSPQTVRLLRRLLEPRSGDAWRKNDGDG